MAFDFSIITGTIVNEYLEKDPLGIYTAIKGAYFLHENGDTVNPNSYFLRFPDKPGMRIIALPAYLGGESNVAGIKWIGSNPENIKQGFPRASAVLILNDYATGYPFACLESSIISATRTAYSAVLAAEYMANMTKKVHKLGFVGNGILAKTIYQAFLALDWQIDEVILYDLDHASSEKLMVAIDKPVKIVGSVDELIKSCDMSVLTTTAPVPYIHDVSLLEHAPIILNVSLRDLAPQLLLASNNVVDDIEHVLQADTAPHLAYKYSKSKGFINGSLSGLMSQQFDLDKSKSSIFSPMGMGILDLALGKYVYDCALRDEKTIEINNFFYELNR